MKKILAILFATSLSSLSLFSQSINIIPIAELESEFITVTRKISTSSALVPNTTVAMALCEFVMDFGNGMFVTNWKKKQDEEAELKDASGKIMQMFSATHALNLLAANGYVLIDNNLAAYGESSLIYTYLLAKKIPDN